MYNLNKLEYWTTSEKEALCGAMMDVDYTQVTDRLSVSIIQNKYMSEMLCDSYFQNEDYLYNFISTSFPIPHMVIQRLAL